MLLVRLKNTGTRTHGLCQVTSGVIGKRHIQLRDWGSLAEGEIHIRTSRSAHGRSHNNLTVSWCWGSGWCTTLGTVEDDGRSSGSRSR